MFTEEDQIIIIVIIGVVFLLFMGLSLLVFFFFSRKKIIEKELEKKLAEIRHQKEIIFATIRSQEVERKRIAQDLHDDISSKLNVIHLSSSLLLHGNLTTEESNKVNKNIIDISNRSIEVARKIAHDLLPPILEKFGFKSAIEEFIDDFNTTKKVDITYDINYPENQLRKESELHLFRIFQELINNSIRHGKAKKIIIDIKATKSKLQIAYKDNGIGFDQKNPKYKKGLGMKNIDSRLELLNGEITIESNINKGVHIIINI